MKVMSADFENAYKISWHAGDQSRDTQNWEHKLRALNCRLLMELT